MLLKNSYVLGDEGEVVRWRENPYMQDFTGERGEGKVFQKRPAMDPARST
jgi:hypothetical protein